MLSCSAQNVTDSLLQVDRSRERLPYSNGFGSMPCSKCIAPRFIPASTTITSPDEPGERLIVDGTIYKSDGKTPAAGIVLFVYQTDVTGYYSKDDDPYDPRLRGWMRPGSDGKYEFRTIKPAPYPHRVTPAHIHAHIYSETIAEYSIDEYWFAGDPFINELQKKLILTGRGGPGSILTLIRDAGGELRSTRDIQLERS